MKLSVEIFNTLEDAQGAKNKFLRVNPKAIPCEINALVSNHLINKGISDFEVYDAYDVDGKLAARIAELSQQRRGYLLYYSISYIEE